MVESWIESTPDIQDADSSKNHQDDTPHVERLGDTYFKKPSFKPRWHPGSGKMIQSWRVAFLQLLFGEPFFGSLRPFSGIKKTEKIGRLLTLNLEMSCAIKLCVFLAMYGQKYASTNVNF